MKTIIFDIDGVLSNNKNHETWFNNKKEFMPDIFKKQLPNFESMEWGVKLIRTLYKEGYNIVIVTARRESFREETIKWLDNKIIPYHKLYTREDNSEFINYKLKCVKQYDVLFIVEDNPNLVEAYRKKGYVVLQPNNRYEENKQ